MRNLTCLARMLGLVLILSESAYAQDQIHDEMQEIYRKYEGALEKDLENEVSYFMKLPSQNGATDAEKRKALIDASNSRNYQRLIDRMFCWEKAKSLGTSAGVATCISERDLKSNSVLRYVFDYPGLTHTFALCEMKTRLVELESKYPPFAHMKTYSAPRAYDSEQFLDCVKSKL